MLDKKNFPFAKIRPEQQEIIDTINNNLDKRYIIIEAATGIGKSPLAIDAALADENGYIVTDSIQLQNQYEKDFINQLVSIKGKNNYTCNINPSVRCDACMLSANPKKLFSCMQSCKFYTQKRKAINSPVCLTNYSYFLISSMLDPKFKARNTIVFDEAHLLEKHLTELYSIEYSYDTWEEKYSISDYLSDEETKIVSQPLSSFNGEYHKLTSILKTAMDKIEEEIDEQINKAKEMLYSADEEADTVDTEIASNILGNSVKSLEEVKALRYSLNHFNNDAGSDWVKGITILNNNSTNKVYETLQLKPLKVDWAFSIINEFANNHIYFMSATILDKHLFCESLGIDENDTLFIRKDSPFDPNKSPIFTICNCGTSYNELQDIQNLDKIVESVKSILNMYPNEKGIIHSGNKKISAYIKKKLNDQRLLVNVGSTNNREIYDLHLKSKKPTVLVSSSMAEGVDLKDDLSRFQIIVKLPFESMADLRVKQLMNARPDWYNCEMMKKLIQQCGRSTRSVNDCCDTYMLDDNFMRYFGLAKKKNWLPSYFIQRCRQWSNPNC